MSPDDPRHGTNAGYMAHTFDREPKCDACRTAHADYKRGLRARRYLARRDRLYIDSTGTVRRIRALQAIGWRLPDIDEALGRTPGTSYTFNLTSQPRVHLDTARAVAEVYERLSMKLGPSEVTRNRARSKGWLPPLAWDDDTIDDPAAKPVGTTNPRHIPKHDVDPIVVERLLAGQQIKATKGEKDEAMRRWLALGRSEKSLCEMHGWHDGRYGLGEAS